MTLRYQVVDLHLTHAFTISRSSDSVRKSVIVELEHDGITGFGEAAPSLRYGETPDTVAAFFSSFDLTTCSDPFRIDAILGKTGEPRSNTSARAAIDMALHDWIGKKLGVPVWKLFGLSPDACPVSSFTIGIDTPEVVEKKVHEATDFPVLKVKVGVPGDEELVASVRRLTDKPIRVDANEGWKTKEEAYSKIRRLEELGVEFVEQPLPAGQIEDTAWLRGHVDLPIIADENVARLADVHRIAYAFDGINIKLMKSGGIREAVRMIHTARALGLKTMLGCMIETSIGISAAAQLLPLVDYADLDGNALITNDPYAGAFADHGVITLSDRPGLGAIRRPPAGGRG
jgi:L-alanine-DL-glutamate epimerase-like enolase superfamily enzyme